MQEASRVTTTVAVWGLAEGVPHRLHHVARDRDEHARAAIHKNLAPAHWLSMRSDGAIEHNQRALARYRAAGDKAGEGDVLNNLGLVLERSGRYEQAVDHSRQALPLRLATGNRRGEGVTLQNLGNAYDRLGRYDEAVEQDHRALVINNLGDTHLAMNEREPAITCHEQALALAEELDHPQEMADAHEGIGHALHADDSDAAHDHWRQALEIYERLHVPEADTLRAHLTSRT